MLIYRRHQCPIDGTNQHRDSAMSVVINYSTDKLNYAYCIGVDIRFM
jgi:hypothetical protein